MGLRHLRLYFLFLSVTVLSFSSCSSKRETPSLPTQKVRFEDEKKETLEARLKEEKEPLLQLVRMRALFDLKRYEEVLAVTPTEDERFSPYVDYLRILSHHELKQFAEVLKIPLPEDLPSQPLQRAWLARGEAFEKLEHDSEARELYEDFLSAFRRSPLTSEVLYRMAELELRTGQRQRALDLFERVYRDHPLSEVESQAKQKLSESGRLLEMDTEYHFDRISRLQSAARFERAEAELSKLKNVLKPEQLPRISLALARLDMAQKRYEKVQRVAAAEMKRLKGTPFELEWQQLAALASTRSGDFDSAITQYQQLLKQPISRAIRESTLLRMGFIFLDDEKFTEAAKSFETLRKDFRRGRFLESAHWFGAWAILMEQYERRDKGQTLDRERLYEAGDLLRRLIALPEGKSFEPSALYWHMKISEWLRDNNTADQTRGIIKRKFTYTFPNLFLQSRLFGFLENHEVIQSQVKAAPFQYPQKFDRLLSWQRLEAFQSVQLDNWAKYELDRFIDEIDVLHPDTASVVAERFETLGDWDDLIRFADRYLRVDLEHLDLEDRRVRHHYPLAYREAVVGFSKRYNISPFLVWGLMRQESRFDHNAVSPAGAVGLMQLMPRLWARISRSIPVGAATHTHMTNPERNIRAGVYHLMELRQQVADFPVPAELRPVLIVAAYNAGIEAVQRWVKENDTKDIDVFVENIPFSETRSYVKRVLQNAWIYSQLYGEPSKEVSINRRNPLL